MRVRSVAEAIIAEECAKRHNVLAERRIEDLVLPALTRQACDELIEEQHWAAVLRAHSLEPRHRVLPVGPPGNGKTSPAEAIAEALAVAFFVVRYEAMIGSFLGDTAARLKRVFDYARTTACVLFFDEFDAVGKERRDIHETGEIKRVVTSLLMQVDDLPSYPGVVAVTNRAQLLHRPRGTGSGCASCSPPPRRELAAYITRSPLLWTNTLVRQAERIATTLGGETFGFAPPRVSRLSQPRRCLSQTTERESA